MDHHSLAATAVIIMGIVGCVSIFTGHDGLEIVLASIVAVAGGVPVIGSWVDQKSKTTAQVAVQK